MTQTQQKILEKWSYPSQYVEIEGSKMHFVEVGEGDPILFLHGVPTSCYLWRNVLPHLATLGRCIAVDLIGMGLSDKPDIEYSVVDHIHYIEKFIKKLNLKRITLVMHGWGSVIGFDYAMRHENNCKGLVFYEAFLRAADNAVSLPFQEQVLEMQDQDLVADSISFVDKVIPQTVMRQLTDEEMNYYRRPYLLAGTGKPISQYLKEIPKGDGKSKIDKLITDYSKKLTKSLLPKLMLYSMPGFVTTIVAVMWAKENLPNLELIDIGEELHLAQETCPDLIGESISVWLQGVEQTT